MQNRKRPVDCRPSRAREVRQFMHKVAHHIIRTPVIIDILSEDDARQLLRGSRTKVGLLPSWITGEATETVCIV
jgi:hypothetical protein